METEQPAYIFFYGTLRKNGTNYGRIDNNPDIKYIGKFKTDSEETRRSFLIAQDVQAVFPEAVEASDPDKLGVQYTDMIPLLVAAIKELAADFQSYKSSHP